MALTWPVEQEGSKGEDVRTVQFLLRAPGHPTGVDGVFGPLTKAAVQAFESSRGLAADGIVGQQTWPRLVIQVQLGSSGDAVRAVQSQLHSRGDGNQIAIDGIFGPATDSAVRAFQKLLGLSVDGIVGPQTWNHLVTRFTIAWGPSIQYDTGGPNAVALDDQGDAVEVHVGTDGLFYRVGTVNFTNQTIAWGPSTQYDTGGPNAVALDDQGDAVEVHVGTDRLFYRVGHLK
jgi:peptidoglycan hydrolase-like protein with peptidoglycan-binding domain